ncbi:MAG: response regulator [Elusimicrobia bacterium]|nr:response regulator [Elusimicrobiota bacterium]
MNTPPEPSESSSRKAIRLIHLEDDKTDAELLRALFEEAHVPCEIRRVQSREEYQSLLNAGGFDLIISDYTLPSFDGASALRMALETHPDIPFLYFSGTIGEDGAVQALLAGATDYVLKSNPKRLIPAVLKAIKEAKEKSEKKQLEQQFLQSQKMEAVGRLAGGVAHDFNNLLTAILGNCEFALQALGDNHPACKDIEEIRKSARRAADLTRQLLAFSRKQIIEPKILSLNTVLIGLEKLLHRLIGEDIDLEIVKGKNLGLIKADAGQIEQIIMNLAINARDAMTQGGKLVIETSNSYLDQSQSGTFHVTPGFYVTLTVTDTGCGMSKDILTHMFEPFFTTKETGKGTGLGLSTVYGIVKQSAGYIWANSVLGEGTTFTLSFPQVQETSPTPKKDSEPPRSIKGEETVLVVEDEEIVRFLIRRALTLYGYSVLEAPNGEEALKICREQGPIHILVTDMVMPHMSGSNLAKEVTQMRPQTKVLYLSGYSDSVVTQDGVIREGIHFLQKPFTPDALAKKVREVLESPS